VCPPRFAQADQRALTVEAIRANAGCGAQAGAVSRLEVRRIEHPAHTPGQTWSRPPAVVAIPRHQPQGVYVVVGDPSKKRIVTTGETSANLVEVNKGLKARRAAVAKTKNARSSPMGSRSRRGPDPRGPPGPDTMGRPPYCPVTGCSHAMVLAALFVNVPVFATVLIPVAHRHRLSFFSFPAFLGVDRRFPKVEQLPHQSR